MRQRSFFLHPPDEFFRGIPSKEFIFELAKNIFPLSVDPLGNVRPPARAPVDRPNWICLTCGYPNPEAPPKESFAWQSPPALPVAIPLNLITACLEHTMPILQFFLCCK